MKLITYDRLSRVLEGASTNLERSVDILLVGGSAVLVWCPDGTATKDLDAMKTEGIGAFIDAVRRWCLTQGEDLVDVNTRADPFEICFPEEWRDNVHRSSELSSGTLGVHVPRPEDLAVAKVFRFVAKDAEDIRRLSALSLFDRKIFLAGFLNVLPFVIGDPREHALSFAQIWNRLYAGEALDFETLLKRAGLSSR